VKSLVVALHELLSVGHINLVERALNVAMVDRLPQQRDLVRTLRNNLLLTLSWLLMLRRVQVSGWLNFLWWLLFLWRRVLSGSLSLFYHVE
jgi:hypothetical protein